MSLVWSCGGVPYSDAWNAYIFGDGERIVLVSFLWTDTQFFLQCCESSEQTRAINYVVVIET
jgi:hypothetical protein